MNQDPQPTNTPPYVAPNTNPDQPTPPVSPEPKKKGMLIAIIAVIAVVVIGAIAFAMMNQSPKDDNNKATNNSSSEQSSKKDDGKYQEYSVTDKQTGITFSVSFYKGASVQEKNGRTFLNAGEEGSQYSTYIVGGKTGKIDCGSAASTTMTLNGSSTTVCYSADNTQYGGFVTINGQTVQLNVAGQKPISQEEAKAIMESASFK